MMKVVLMMNKKHGLILYQYNKFNKDLTYIKEYFDYKEIQKDFNIEKISIYQYIIDSIDKIDENTRMLESNYLLFR